MPLVHLILAWLVSALALLIVARIIPGIEVRSFGTAMVAAAVLAIVDFTLRRLVLFLVLPLTILTFGLFLLAVNAFLLKVASLFTPGFKVRGILHAILGAFVLTILTSLLDRLVF